MPLLRQGHSRSIAPSQQQLACLFLYIIFYFLRQGHLRSVTLSQQQIACLLANAFFCIYSCPMKTHHCSDAHICGLLKGVLNCIIYNYHLGHMQCFRTKILIPVTPLTHDVTSASKLRYSHFRRIEKDPKISFKCFLFASRSPVISPQL